MNRQKSAFLSIAAGIMALLSITTVYSGDNEPGSFGPATSSETDSIQVVASNRSGMMSGAKTLQSATRYRLDAGQSQFIAHAHASGLLWFMGHDHLLKVQDFAGEIQLTPGPIRPASLTLTIRADSLQETGAVFTPEQKQIINKEVNELVLETATYPEIRFVSTEVTGEAKNNEFNAKITGDLTLHGVTRRLVIPTTVSVTGNDLHARGEFSIDRSDFKVKATTAKGGTIRVRNKVTFNFDILAHRS